MPTVPHASLKIAVRAMLAAMGSAEAEAETVADHLVEANLRGHDSHGVGMMPKYVENWQAGTLAVNRPLEIVRDDGPFLVADAGGGHGQVAAMEITRRTLARARETGVAVSGLILAHHVGRVGTYGEACAAAGMVSIQFVNVGGHPATVAPFRGRDARFLTNPVCIAVPAGEGRPPVVLDFATSGVALGKVRVALNEGRRMADGLLIDSAGRPTGDPAVMFAAPAGALTPMGAHKGYGLALMAELLGAALTGGMTIRPERGRDAGIRNNMLTIIIDPDRLAGREPFLAEVAAVVDWVKASPPADPAEPVLVAGEPEQLSRAERLRTGIPIDRTTWAGLQAAAEAAGLGAERFASLAQGR